MARSFDPTALLGALIEGDVEFVLIGGLAATLYGSPHVTTDADIVPAADRENLERLAAVLGELQARIRTEGEPDGLTFDISATTLASVEMLDLTTRFGNLDITFVPSGTRGFPDLNKNARIISVHGIALPVASLADVIRSKEAANREKDRLVLPTLRELLERSNEDRSGD